ncbi:MAG: cbb3-type cytochrome c oxidase subunit I [Imperialibacter sp.]|uniref:cbb3-type cytochrome c oxidase subunit I n=1 Tax=Imperialibacter sp. TaxID=2038411 RepID=UPI003A8939EA
MGTLVGQYAGMKFVWPDMDHTSWLSFGRLRPVHTNTVFWGWASMAMIGLAYFVIARTSNTTIHSYKKAWIAWGLFNLSVLLGNICLMAGINNGGGEYREFIWPVMLLFAAGLLITFRNFYLTVAHRKISEIYISNWFILASLTWTIILVLIAYLPFYQNGLGETIIQGYYMHQGVGMWFMTFSLGLVYYYLPSSLNKPIYSYSLGVLAFWTQMLFYTLIGTHHFVFSPLPWWLQTVAIVFSAGMFIPVVTGTTNFLMTMKGSWNHISKSYVLPFFLVGVIFYFVGSTQGSLQAFRFTNFVWHFTDFNVAHSHMTMYGIITFILWGCIYHILPKLTDREPPQVLVGAHFWMAFIGLFAYMVSLMAGGTLKGLSWIDGHPFIESVILMKPFWLWRAIGGSLMFVSHIIFAFNFYYMVKKKVPVELPVSNHQKKIVA